MHLAYRFMQGQVIRQTIRQVQQFRSESEPERGGESVLVSRTEGRVIDVDPDGTALIDEITTFENDPRRRDRRRVLTRPTGEILWMDVLEGQPPIIQGGAMLLGRPVRPGQSWPTTLKGAGGGPGADMALTVTFKSLVGADGKAVAALSLDGRMDSAALNAMIGEAAAAQGIRGKGCTVTGEVLLRVESGQEVFSLIALDCALEIVEEGKAPSPAALTLSYETQTEETPIPSIPAP